MSNIPPSPYVGALQTLYAQHANPENAAPMARYMKDRFPFFGLKSPERTALSKTFIQANGIPVGDDLKAVCQLCFQAEQREMQYFVNDLLEKVIKKLQPDFLPTLESLILQKSWWDTVDFLAPKFIGNILLRFSDQIGHYPMRWIKDDNIWLQRSAILFQLKYKKQTDPQLLFDFILQRADSKEFFVQKAAGWALRQYARVNPEAIRAFVAAHELPKLTVREGTKHL